MNWQIICLVFFNVFEIFSLLRKQIHTLGIFDGRYIFFKLMILKSPLGFYILYWLSLNICTFLGYLDHFCRVFLLVGTFCSTSGSSTSSASDSSLSEVSIPPYKLSFIPAPDLRLLKLSFVGLLELLPNPGFRFWSNLADLLVLGGSWTSKALGLVFSMMMSMSAACSSKSPIKKSADWNIIEMSAIKK